MYLHKENKELFQDVVFLTSERMGISTDIVEKDYYVTMILGLLAQEKYPVVFKGGTSLSKAFGIIDRFSEDIDITFTEHLGESRRKHLKYDVLKPIAENLGFEIKNWKSIESDKDYNHYDFYYNSIVTDSASGLMPYVKLETALMSFAFPIVKKQISNYIYDALSEEEPELMENCRLNPFSMKVQAIERTLIDKIFALCDYYIQDRAWRNSRHLYDIYKLAECVNKNSEFRKLVEEVRSFRRKMDEKIAPSARADVDMQALIQKLCEEDFYKQDYVDTTMRLISDSLDYETAKKFYLEFTKDLF